VTLTEDIIYATGFMIIAFSGQIRKLGVTIRERMTLRHLYHEACMERDELRAQLLSERQQLAPPQTRLFQRAAVIAHETPAPVDITESPGRFGLLEID